MTTHHKVPKNYSSQISSLEEIACFNEPSRRELNQNLAQSFQDECEFNVLAGQSRDSSGGSVKPLNAKNSLSLNANQIKFAQRYYARHLDLIQESLCEQLKVSRTTLQQYFSASGKIKKKSKEVLDSNMTF